MYKKTIYLVRHAKSSWNDENLPDRLRPLNKQGHKNAVDMAARMAALKIKVDLMVSSPAKRALTTANYFAEELGYDAFDISVDERMYFCGTKGLVNVLKSLPEDVDKVMLIGHNPDISELLKTLTGNKKLEPMSTSNVAKLQLRLSSWKELQTLNAELIFLETPDKNATVAPGQPVETFLVGNM